uniref:Protein sel-1 homolog 3-like n=1 Tax=Gouania willdenowi TaxID=441366 RepID=A0A8C5H748_GOUWI
MSFFSMQGHCMLQTTSTHSGDNFLGFDTVPDRVLDGSAVRVRYQCSRPCQLTLEVVVSVLKKTDLVVFRRKWISSVLKGHRIHQVLLRLPPSISYQLDFFNRNILDSHNMTVRACMDYFKNSSELSTFDSSRWRIFKEIQTLDLSERPSKPPPGCPSWSAQLMWRITSQHIHQCLHEPVVLDMLNFPMASSGGHFGLVHRFQPFLDRTLEKARLLAVTQPSVTLSLWIYQVESCHKQLCGIIHHVNRKNNFDSVMLQLTGTGDIVFQVRSTTGTDKAFRANTKLPLWKWIRLDCYIKGSKVMLDTVWDDETRRYVYEFQDGIYYDDTDGYFVIGGGKYLPGIHGYFGPVKYYRFGIEKIENPLDAQSTLHELDRTHCECREINKFAKSFLEEVSKDFLPSPNNKGLCTPDFIRLIHKEKKKTCTQAWSGKTQQKYVDLYQFLQRKEDEIQQGSVGIKELRAVLFEQAVAAVFSAVKAQIEIPSRSRNFLQASFCFGNHRASLFLAIVHLSGMGSQVNQQQGHVYSLIGAASNDRFALMHAGYKHINGIDGFPKDFDMAYSYYSNMGAQSVVDISKMHEETQYSLQLIYLNNEDDLKKLTPETSDAFQYLNYKAERGDAQSQKHLASLLYWGQNGLSKDIATAMKWFERSAMQMNDPTAMYDYSVLLMKGHGVKKNYTQGFWLLRKAAEMGSINALNGLGWYYEMVLKDHKSAVKYYEQAALNGSGDGIFNLGVYHLTGKIPGSPEQNESAAFQHFLNASKSGHMSASVEVARYLSTGNLEGVSQDVEKAVIILKNVCDRNGHLGFMIREALQAYLQDSRWESFVNYVLAAESGLGLAQSNTAHLCEELGLSDDCQRRYHNFSVLNHDPHPSALLKMGDYFYYSSSTQADSLSLAEQAISMYGRAALAGSPQGMYNLVVLVHEGHIFPRSINSFFNVSHRDEVHTVMEKILKRCVAIEDEELVTPCSFALLGLQMGKALRRMSQNDVQLLLAYMSLLSVIMVIIFVPLQSCLGQRNHETLRIRSARQQSGNLNQEQVSIMGTSEPVTRNQRLMQLDSQQWLPYASELVVTLSGVCLCVFWTTVLCHVL